jgi:hypothetical protein
MFANISDPYCLVASLNASRVFEIAMWIGLCALSLALLILAWTRWGNVKTTHKCIWLSVFAHILLVLYAYETRLFLPGVGSNGGEAIVHVTIVDDSDTVPFFLLPSLGSGRTLRAYQTGRFRDRHSVLTSAELRWIPNRYALDMALFYDAGKVTNQREDLDFENLTHDWGIGVRFHTPGATVLRIEGARGNDGWRLVFSTGAAW